MPLGVRVEVSIAGVESVLKESQTRSASLKAVRAGIKIVNAAVKPGVPRRSKALATAQGVKAVKGKKGRTGSFAVQGAKTKYKKVWKGKRVVPALYDHLVIGGTKAHGVAKGGGTVAKPHPGGKPDPYRERAYRSVAAQVSATMMRVMKDETEKMLAKASAKMKG